MDGDPGELDGGDAPGQRSQRGLNVFFDKISFHEPGVDFHRSENVEPHPVGLLVSLNLQIAETQAIKQELTDLVFVELGVGVGSHLPQIYFKEVKTVSGLGGGWWTNVPGGGIGVGG